MNAENTLDQFKNLEFTHTVDLTFIYGFELSGIEPTVHRADNVMTLYPFMK